MTIVIFNFGRKKIKFKFQKWPFFYHLWLFFGNYMNIFHKTEIQIVILRCIVCPKINCIKSYNIKLVQKYFFACLKLHHFRAILPKWILTTLRKSAVMFSKQLFFQNSLELSWSIYSEKMQLKKQKRFLNLFSNKIFEFTFVSIFADMTTYLGFSGNF